MTTLEQILKLNEDQRTGTSGLTHKKYLGKWKRLKRQWTAENQPTIAQQVTQFGAKVKKEKGYVGYYIYEGINFTVHLNSAECEHTWWEVDLYIKGDGCEDKKDGKIHNYFYEYNRYDTKQEVVAAILNLDKNYKEFTKEL